MLEHDLLRRLAAILTALGNQECPDYIVSGQSGQAVIDWEEHIDQKWGWLRRGYDKLTNKLFYL